MNNIANTDIVAEVLVFINLILKYTTLSVLDILLSEHVHLINFESLLSCVYAG